jgi:hypothetical protein
LLDVKLPQHLIEQFKEQIQLKEDYSYENTLLYNGLLFQIPRSLKSKVIFNQGEEFINKFKLFFKYLSALFVEEIIPNLKLVLY